MIISKCIDKEAFKVRHADSNNRNVGGIYCRVSTKEQVNGYSLEEQKRICKDYMHNMGIKYFRLYLDEGYTGKNLDRPSFQNMLEHCLQRKITHIIVWKLDRLSRNLTDTLLLIEELDNMGIGVISVTQAIDSTTTLGKIVTSILSGFSQIELENLTERVRMGVRARFKEGKWKGGTTPYGYLYVPKSGILVVDKNEAKIVKLIYLKYLEYESLNQVAEYLNNKEIPTRNEKKWQPTTIRNILGRKTYIGILKQGNIEVKSEGLRIITNNVFESVNDLLEKRKRFAPHTKKKISTEIDEHYCEHCGTLFNEVIGY